MRTHSTSHIPFSDPTEDSAIQLASAPVVHSDIAASNIVGQGGDIPLPTIPVVSTRQLVRFDSDQAVRLYLDPGTHESP